MKKILGLGLALLLAGCTDENLASMRSFGKKHKIEALKCTGEVARTYISTGQVTVHEGGQACWEDSETHQQICISGDYIVTVLKED